MQYKIIGKVVRRGKEFGIILPDHIVEKEKIKQGQKLLVFSVRKLSR